MIVNGGNCESGHRFGYRRFFDPADGHGSAAITTCNIFSKTKIHAQAMQIKSIVIAVDAGIRDMLEAIAHRP